MNVIYWIIDDLDGINSGGNSVSDGDDGVSGCGGEVMGEWCLY